MLTFTIRAIIDFDNQREFLQTAEIVLKKIRKEKGCMSCHVVKDFEDEKVFLLIEEWKTREDLFSHLCSRDFGALSGALHVLSNETEMKIHTISSTEGIETLTKVRNQNKSKKRRLLKNGPEQNIVNRIVERKVPLQSL